MEQLVEQLKALGDMTRLKIFRLLVEKEYCVCELAAIIGISQPGISQHLRKMKVAGWVTERREGQWVYYKADKAAWGQFEQSFRDFLSTDLAAVPQMQCEVERISQLERNPIVLACKPKKTQIYNNGG